MDLAGTDLGTSIFQKTNNLKKTTSHLKPTLLSLDTNHQPFNNPSPMMTHLITLPQPPSKAMMTHLSSKPALLSSMHSLKHRKPLLTMALIYPSPWSSISLSHLTTSIITILPPTVMSSMTALSLKHMNQFILSLLKALNKKISATTIGCGTI